MSEMLKDEMSYLLRREVSLQLSEMLKDERSMVSEWPGMEAFEWPEFKRSSIRYLCMLVASHFTS